ncbi:MAG: uroporphyrinogen-III synthase [Gammaproteobacteria bacterium]|nr:uroporphyrinogen-III synthase [Gammaproteobacteria bacterium]
MGKKPDLKGLKVLITRPIHQAETMCHLIELHGGVAHRFPVLEILPVKNAKAVHNTISHLDDFDIAIFISPNAVTYTCQLTQHPRQAFEFIQLAAVGKGTQRALLKFGLNTHISPTDEYHSEALLATSALQSVTGRKIIIFRGEGGRTLIADTLRQRGAWVEYMEVYRRSQPTGNTHCLLDLKIDMIVITSNESLHNIFNMTLESDKAWLLNKPLVVFSQRTAKLVQSLGFTHPARVTRIASDEGLLETLSHE